MASVRLREANRGQVVTFDWELNAPNFVYEGEPGKFVSTQAGAGWLHLGDRVVPFHAIRQGNVVEVWIAGQVYKLEPETRQAAPAIPEDSGKVTAPMPGTVLQLLVQVGDVVAARQPVLVLESMKMELTLQAAGAGRVSQVHCKRGDLVEMGAVLVSVEPHAAS